MSVENGCLAIAANYPFFVVKSSSGMDTCNSLPEIDPMQNGCACLKTHLEA